LPCPFCGVQAAVFCETSVWWVRCENCQAESGSSDTDDGAAEIWNLRSKPAAGGVKPAIDSPTVVVGYTNWRGQYGEREIVPMRPWFGSTDWHPEEQWLLKAWDVERDAERDFAIKDVGFKSPQPEAGITDEMVERAAACIKGGSTFSQEDRADMARAALTAALSTEGQSDV
jgi:hypothetical protein